MDHNEILKSAHTILVIDWPSKEAPDALARAGFYVAVKGGPGPEDYFAHELSNDGQVVSRRTGRPPECVDLVYSYRPLSELPNIIATAKNLRAKTIWTQSGLSAAGVKDPKGCWLSADDLQSAQSLVHSSRLRHIAQPYIVDAVRTLQQ
jgi:hypothetical protein